MHRLPGRGSCFSAWDQAGNRLLTTPLQATGAFAHAARGDVLDNNGVRREGGTTRCWVLAGLIAFVIVVMAVAKLAALVQAVFGG